MKYFISNAKASCLARVLSPLELKWKWWEYKKITRATAATIPSRTYKPASIQRRMFTIHFHREGLKCFTAKWNERENWKMNKKKQIIFFKFYSTHVAVLQFVYHHALLSCKMSISNVMNFMFFLRTRNREEVLWGTTTSANYLSNIYTIEIQIWIFWLNTLTINDTRFTSMIRQLKRIRILVIKYTSVVTLLLWRHPKSN